MPLYTCVTPKKKQTSERQEAAETLSSHAVTSTAAVHKVGPGNVWFISNRDYVLEARLPDIKAHLDMSSTCRILLWRNLKSGAPPPLCCSPQPSPSPAFSLNITCQRTEELETAMCAYYCVALKDFVFTNSMPKKTDYATCAHTLEISESFKRLVPLLHLWQPIINTWQII